ncbi:MAG: TerC/Alx family metal homeostasis membrane protein [Candidatus Nanopelagicales bacterium]|nr:TerC/Alx family metal homeostasis membrane protein [Candidatus Nanopelagicales bacterium]
MSVSLGLWFITIGGLLLLVVLDFVAVSRKPHEVQFKEAVWWSIFYIGIAIAFGVALFVWQGPDFGTQFFTAYLVEKSLSVDNLFVFLIILTQFAVPYALHQRVLLVGVVLALFFRAIFIAVGAAALATFAFTFVIFGAILIWTGIQLARHRNEDPDPMDSGIARFIQRRIPSTPTYDGKKLFTHIDGKKLATPLLTVMLLIGVTDVLFALDSIPATFGVTQEAFLVFTANAFALLGLRALYFLLKGLLDKLIYLSTGLAVILVFIGIKLVLTYLHETWPSIPKIPTAWSLIVIAVILVVVTLASLIKVRKDPSAVAHAGRLLEHDEEN